MSRHITPRANWVSAATLLVACPLAIAGPLVLEESARLVSPDPEYPLNHSVAVDGDFIIAIGSSFDREESLDLRRGYLFRRDGGRWTYVRTLFTDANASNQIWVPVSLAMAEGWAAINYAATQTTTRLNVFQRSGADYVQVPATGRPEGTDVEIDAGTVLSSDGTCSWDAQTFRRDASGAWVRVGGGGGLLRGCDDEFRGGDVALSGNRFIIGNEFVEDSPPSAQIFTGVQGTPIEHRLFNPDGPALPFAARVGLQGNVAIVSGSASSGEYVFVRDASGVWNDESKFRPADVFAAGLPEYLELEGGRLLRPRAQDGGAVGVFRRSAPGEWEYLAKLVPSRGQLTQRVADSSGNRVVAQGTDAAYVWDLPTDFSQPALRQDDFQDGNAADWLPQAGGDFAVVTGTQSLVYRQRSLAGNATSLLSASAWRNQSIQADIKPIEFQAADRWLGLAVRYVDAGNYYYVTLRQSGSLQLRRLVDGVFVTLASTRLSVVPGRTYNVRLEAVGGTLRAYVDGKAMLRARDTTHAQGRAGLIMYRTRADYDNVVVSANPFTTLLHDDFENANDWWTPEGDGQWSVVTDGSSRAYQQSSVAGGARSATGVNITADQIIEARVKATAFGSGVGRWFGLMARYQDAGNYYYITLRNDNTVSLRKLVNGAIVVLDQARLTVTTNTWYALRLEAIGGALRAYVDGRLLLEAHDDMFAQGSYGIAMYKAATRVDDFKVVEP